MYIYIYRYRTVKGVLKTSSEKLWLKERIVINNNNRDKIEFQWKREGAATGQEGFFFGVFG